MLVIFVTFCVSFALSQACGRLSELQDNVKGRRSQKRITLQWFELLRLLISAVVRSYQLLPKIWILLATLWRREDVKPSDESFFAFSPEADETCQFYLFSKLDLCKNKISWDERQYAASIRQALGTVIPGTSEYENLFSEYIQLCTCSQIHRILLRQKDKRKNNDRFNAKTLAWKRELQSLYHSCLATGLAGKPSMPGDYPDSKSSSPVEGSFQDVPQAYSDQFRRKSAFEHPSQDAISSHQHWSFGSYSKANERSLYLRDDICSRLTKKETKTGFIYIYRRLTLKSDSPPTGTNLIDADTKHLKIGYTTQSVKGRMSEIKRECNYNLEVLWCKEVPYANRVERLIHAELEIEGKRRMESYCRFNKQQCPKRHGEWFEIDEQNAKRVCDHWCNWMLQHMPYAKNLYPKDQFLVEMYKDEPKKPVVSNGAPENSTDSSNLSFHHNSQGELWYIRPGLVSPTESSSNAQSSPSPNKIKTIHQKQTSADTVRMPKTFAAMSRTPKRGHGRKSSFAASDILTPPALSTSSSSSSVPQTRSAFNSPRTPSPAGECEDTIMADAYEGIYPPWNGFEDSPTMKKSENMPEVVTSYEDDEMSRNRRRPISVPKLFAGRGRLRSPGLHQILSLEQIDKALQKMTREGGGDMTVGWYSIPGLVALKTLQWVAYPTDRVL